MTSTLKWKRLFAAFIVLALSVTFVIGCEKSSGSETAATDEENQETQATESEGAAQTTGAGAAGEPTVIVFGTHWQAGDDPNWKDPVTGEPGMPPEQLLARQKAQEAVLNELNVEIQWVQYPSDVREALLKSVLANAPIVDIALLWGGSQGTLLGQNIFQPLDEYEEIFSDEDSAWMLGDEMFGGKYFLNYILDFVNAWPLVYNVSYLDKVDALKENGRTVYPHDLWKQGKWTWSAFEDYLTKVNEYYANKMSPVRTDVPIKAFQTDYRYTALQAIHANGGAVYGANGLTADAPEAKKAVEYIDKLMSKNLMMSVRYGEDTSVPGWTWNGSDFGNGETVFTNMVPWLSNGAGQSLAARGESMGVVPFPRPDDLAADDPKVEQVIFPGNQMAVLKGLSKEKTELALKAYKVYWSTVYKTLANSDKALDFFEKQAKNTAINYGFDVTNEQFGDAVMEAFIGISGSSPNEYATIMPWGGMWTDTILGNSLYGLNGSPKYAGAIDAQKNVIVDSMSSIEQTISSGVSKDNMPPSFSTTGVPIAVAAGTDPATVQWDTFVKAQDGIDGEIPFANVAVDTSAVKFDSVGKYDGGLALAVKDAAGNEGKASHAVIVYDPNNATAPTIAAKAEYRAVKVDEDASAINWANDFVEQAVDKDGFDLKSKITADIGSLDVTTPGTYDVTLTVTDFAGNQASLTIPVAVE
ncbi:immunoglobulin-like domain-containing protein [Paenibacillus sp.]|uniref:immunoglobulin-like domain-containing protein n=1 Tax=Paenibacillus sp. TaxID=58172 RepID=UPI002811F378|nr:immunoglobulin-like domain-containing protein [Paenibacillus sp.]